MPLRSARQSPQTPPGKHFYTAILLVSAIMPGDAV
jgi:hypothetical protein